MVWKMFSGSLQLRNLGGLALVASASVLVAACATDGAGNPNGLGGPEGPGNSSEHPGSSYDGPGSNGTERPEANCTATVGDLLDVFSGLCEVVEECGFTGTPDPEPNPEDTQEYVYKPTARMALDRVVEALPVTRTRGNSENPDLGAEIFGGLCEAVNECRDGGCGVALDQTVDTESGVCIGSYLNCFRAIFALISCDGDLSNLDESDAPAACQELFETPDEPPPEID